MFSRNTVKTCFGFLLFHGIPLGLFKKLPVRMVCSWKSGGVGFSVVDVHFLNAKETSMEVVIALQS